MLSRAIQKRHVQAHFRIVRLYSSLPDVRRCPLTQPLHYRISSDPALKGKGKDGKCIDYAIALSSRLASKGIHGQLIFYRWHIHNTTTTGSHVFVVYHLSDGTKWIVDNELTHPKPVPVDSNPMQLVYLLSRIGYCRL